MNRSQSKNPCQHDHLIKFLYQPLAALLLTLTLVTVVNAEEKSSIIKNPDFEAWQTYGSQSYPISWSPQQHAGELSFSFSQDEDDFVSGESSLRIERIGSQPWGSVTQVIPPGELKGKRVRFSVEARMDDTVTDGLSLMLVVKGAGVGGSPIYTRKFDGINDWQNVSIEGVVPKSATRITIGITLESGQFLWLDDAKLQVLP